MPLEHLSADTSAEQLHGVPERDGALIIDNLASVDTVARINAEMAPC